MLYAYGIGLGADPMDEKELAFVNEGVAIARPLKIVPTFASVAAWADGAALRVVDETENRQLLGSLGMPLPHEELAFVSVQLRCEPTLSCPFDHLQSLVQQGHGLLDLPRDLTCRGQ